MNRVRYEWTSIWVILGAHFNMVGCHCSRAIAGFALDSLRQLSVKFLEKEELAHYRFQEDFLQPFDYIMRNNNDVSIRDMVLRCLAQIIQARVHSIKSGWRTVFQVLLTAANDDSGRFNSTWKMDC